MCIFFLTKKMESGKLKPPPDIFVDATVLREKSEGSKPFLGDDYYKPNNDDKKCY